MTTNMITVKQLTYKRNRKVILDDLNLDLVQGHFIGLLGANGAGKTTLMRLLNGVATTFHGTIQIGSSESIVERKQLSSFSESLNGVNPNRTLKQIATYYADMYLDFSEAEFANLTELKSGFSYNYIIKTNKYEDNNYVLTITEQTQIIGWEDENHDPITSDPSIAETGTEITNPSWNITEETVTPQPVVK